MREHPIIFSTDMAKAILKGRKTQTRRVIKPQPYFNDKNCLAWKCSGYRTQEEIARHCPYGQVGDRLWCKQNYYLLNEELLGDSDILYRLTDDRIYAILTMEVQDGRYKTDEWGPSQAYPNLPQRGLYGGVGWSNLLTNKIQRLWAEGIRGLVSATRTQQRQGLSEHINVSPESQGYSECSPLDMYGFSWDATIPIISDTAFRRQSGKQSTRQSEMGDSRGKLDGQEGSRQGNRRGETPDGKAHGLRDESVEVVNRERISQSAPRSEDSWDVAGWNIRRMPSEVLKIKPSIFMPRWASRITLEIDEIRVERVQEIWMQDAIAEGCSLDFDMAHFGDYTDPISKFKQLWGSINAKRGYSWDTNPWVWVISFNSK